MPCSSGSSAIDKGTSAGALPATSGETPGPRDRPMTSAPTSLPTSSDSGVCGLPSGGMAAVLLLAPFSCCSKIRERRQKRKKGNAMRKCPAWFWE